jgi:tetratricopeptide (TPR) repeat protein
VAAFGDPDDHLRLTAILASHLGGGDADRDAAVCLGPRSPWRARRDALGEILARHRPKRAGDVVAGVVDPDMLYAGSVPPEVAWDDRSFVRDRNELFRVLVQAAERGGWVFLRTAPRKDASLELEGVGLAETEPLQSPGPNQYTDALAGLAPSTRPICRWLVQEGALTAKRAAATIQGLGPAADEEIIATAYDRLARSARDAVKRLSLVRPAQAVNGALGRFAVVEREPSARQVSRAAVKSLCDAGFLQPGVAPSTLRVPVLVRQFLAARARWSLTEPWEAEHRWLAQAAGESAEEATEAHFHAIHSGDAQLAVETARYYGSDLRALAYRLSCDEERFAEAAQIYKRVVEDFDANDAYAWEYYAFNLVRARDKAKSGFSASDIHEISDAYRRAVSLAQQNPLYHGRYLGFRARIGDDVREEVVEALRRYQTAHGSAATSFFGDQVLKGLRAGGKRSLTAELLKRWPAIGHKPSAEP